MPSHRLFQFSLRKWLLLLVISAIFLGAVVRPGRLLPGKVKVHFYPQGFMECDDGSGEGPKPVAVVGVLNMSGHTIWYRGSGDATPNYIVETHADGKCESGGTGTEPSKMFALHSGETRLFLFGWGIPNATSVRVGLAFKTSWFDRQGQVAMSEVIPVALPPK